MEGMPDKVSPSTGKKKAVEGQDVPDRNEECLLTRHL
jgi:hypothetical protein